MAGRWKTCGLRELSPAPQINPQSSAVERNGRRKGSCL